MIDKNIKHIHFIGIKGVAMTALAIFCKEAGIKVTGSDTEEIFVTDKVLKQKEIKWNIGFKKENIIGRPDLVVVTGAHGGLTNKEAVAAKEMRLPVRTHAQVLGMFMKGYQEIAVCGVGGKSTVASMIATILTNAGLNPCYAIGVAFINPLGAGGHYGQGSYFVAEADEYATAPKNDLTPRFMWFSPKIAVITNIEYDHPDVYKDIKQTKETFLKFVNKVPADGLIVVNGENKNIQDILPQIKGKAFTYGFGKENNYQIKRETRGKGEKGEKGEMWDLRGNGRGLGSFEIRLFGKHTILNATAAIVTCLNLGISLVKIKAGLLTFLGTKRRFEFIGEVKRVKIYDDYAHHPTEIKATLKTAREIFPKNRIICVFQPHTYSRTRALFSDFAKSFTDCDILIITDIYASAREKPDQTINSQKLAKETAKFHQKVKYIGKMEKIADYLVKITKAGDVIFTMGAGNIFNYHAAIIKKIKNQKSKIKNT